MHAWERAQRVLGAGGWPARLARGLGGQRRVTLTTHEIELPLTGAALPPPLRIGFASDFHASPVTHPALLEQAAERLAAAAPDVLLLGGDFVSLDSRWIADVAPLLGAVPAPLGRFAVLGNHDYWAGPAEVTRALAAHGVTLVTNRAVRLAPPWDGVWVCGLDDDLSGEPDAHAACAGADGVRLLLMHAPSGLLDLDGERFDLALCGHTHGGQIALPGGRPIYVPEGRLSRRYARGVHRIEDAATLLVSRGVGYSTLPVRLFAPPEVHLVTLRCERAPAS